MPRPVSRAPTGLKALDVERGLWAQLASLQPSFPVEGLAWLGLQGGRLETSLLLGNGGHRQSRPVVLYSQVLFLGLLRGLFAGSLW